MQEATDLVGNLMANADWNDDLPGFEIVRNEIYASVTEISLTEAEVAKRK